MCSTYFSTLQHQDMPSKFNPIHGGQLKKPTCIPRKSQILFHIQMKIYIHILKMWRRLLYIPAWTVWSLLRYLKHRILNLFEYVLILRMKLPGTSCFANQMYIYGAFFCRTLSLGASARPYVVIKCCIEYTINYMRLHVKVYHYGCMSYHLYYYWISSVFPV